MERTDWDERYGADELVWSAGPNAFLVAETADLELGRALDVACGEGRNAIWLAEQGWTVTGLDFSAVGLAKAARIARARGVEVEWIEADVRTWEPRAEFDLVCVLYLQLPAADRRAAHRQAARSVSPGGRLVVIAHDRGNLTHGVGGPQDPEVLFSAEEVVADIADIADAAFTIERAEQVRRPVDDRGDALDVVVHARRSH